MRRQYSSYIPPILPTTNHILIGGIIPEIFGGARFEFSLVYLIPQNQRLLLEYSSEMQLLASVGHDVEPSRFYT
jgi:hypothetical protein